MAGLVVDLPGEGMIEKHVQAVLAAAEWQRLRGRARLLYVLFYVKHGAERWTTLTLKELAALTGQSTRTIEYASTELVRARLMDVDGRDGEPLRYRLRTPAISAGVIAA